MLYPSGMLVARPAADGSGGITYTKHYFAGTQRVSSKIGTTTNLGKFLEEWQQQEQSSPSYPAITTQAQMDNAKNAANKVYTAFGITPAPTFEGNTSLVAIPAFEHGGNEHDHYFFHPDHLGSSNYITNFEGEVSQHSEYFAFGETFIEEHRNSHNSPYKFNGKELDEESGLYYYGARYYDPRISIWASVDPLVEETLDAYGYCYQNPIMLIDPDGMSPTGGEDPVKSKYLGPLSTSSSFGNGIADGFIGALPEAGEFVWDMITDSNARDDFMEGMKTILSSPLETIKAFAGDKYDLYRSVISGNGTEQQQYDVGKDIGGILFGLATGAGAAKLTEVVKIAKFEKKLLKFAKEADDAIPSGGRANVRGTKIHTEFEKKVGKQKAEISYIDGRVVERGASGSKRADAIFGSKKKPKVAYDLKTGKSGIGTNEAKRYFNNLPKNTKLKEISKDASGNYRINRIKQ